MFIKDLNGKKIHVTEPLIALQQLEVFMSLLDSVPAAGDEDVRAYWKDFYQKVKAAME